MHSRWFSALAQKRLRDNKPDNGSEDDYAPSDDESIDAYKDWYMEKGPDADIHDEVCYEKYEETTKVDDEGNGNGKKVGRGSLKGLAAMAKRAKARTRKLKIDFSKNLGGPCGDNRRTFVDEIVMFTRLHAPLIGVRQWKDVSQEVKNLIVESVMSIWDMGNVADLEENILMIAKERYKGWRFAFSATYKAYDSYDARMKRKPEDLDIVEWHYLNMYFGTSQFKTNLAGKLSMVEPQELGQEELLNDASSPQEDIVFQQTYMETTGVKSAKLAKQAADKEAEKKQLTAAIKDSVMQEVKAMMAQQQYSEEIPTTAINNTTTENNQAPTTETNNTPLCEDTSNQNIIQETPVQRTIQTPNLDEIEPQSFITAEKKIFPLLPNLNLPKLQRIYSTPIMVKELEA
uniref:Uncharacterized protein n=1 Tax=Oryza brachyantha TaxID=4533 RepID=J3N8J6_ORYBR